MQAVDPAVDEAIDHRVRALLQKLNAADCKAMEELAAVEARQVHAAVQKSVPVELPPAKVSNRTIVQDSGLIHDWGQLNPISQVPATRASLIQVAKELKRRLASRDHMKANTRRGGLRTIPPSPPKKHDIYHRVTPL